MKSKQRKVCRRNAGPVTKGSKNEPDLFRESSTVGSTILHELQYSSIQTHQGVYDSSHRGRVASNCGERLRSLQPIRTVTKGPGRSLSSEDRFGELRPNGVTPSFGSDEPGPVPRRYTPLDISRSVLQDEALGSSWIRSPDSTRVSGFRLQRSVPAEKNDR